MKTLNMEDMRHLNLFEKITRVRTLVYFTYNDTLFFCVPKNLVSKAVGEEGKNIKKIHQILGKRVKIIPKPRSIKEIKPFIKNIISPATFNDIEVTPKEVKLKADRQNKSSIIGRDKRRLMEMKKIIRDFFGRDFEIV